MTTGELTLGRPELGDLRRHLTAAGGLTDTGPRWFEADPLWFKRAVFYEIHIRGFADGNGDGIGDFVGLTERLDYLEWLGVDCIWLLPFYASPLRDGGYDISDYFSVHPDYGSTDDFAAFVEQAHQRRIRVIADLVMNHTSSDHEWFRDARSSRDSPKRDWYVWSDTEDRYRDARIIFVDSESSNWTFDPVAGQYYWHRFFSHQPDLNHNNPAVVDAVIDVMKFWLDLGVDALRLDAVPYLCVREGTNNENLPETHAVLKRMRRELDARYRGRMLLAEANQWPADVRAYFGDGDECHMAFHFPLMPRMFMALRQEDRHAITEILNQTPDIPESCQWALFLRNHDELTLEMVTDEERDYMYSVYADDPQMRLNVGIRRRLAPLVENSRRRMELLHSLLFALPGTPIVYYGDEIGMGDNIYLGDRNGVRTPMQWTSDRNAGFSRADPARLYAPPIMDPVYGYEAINVEAQERYPFSLLTWMKRLVAMRKQHRVFGRGTLEILYPANRKILAFLRRDEHETILVVANLSRALQPVSLDLNAFAGLMPVEMAGMTEFPRIGDQPYFLTLGPYASHWFTLQRQPVQTAPRVARRADPNDAILESLPALMMGIDWQNVLDSATRLVLERHALKGFLERQRWFASKSREIKEAGFSDWAVVRKGPEPAFVTVIAVEYDGWSESYLLPLSLAAGAQAERLLRERTPAVLARITGARKGVIVDGIEDDDTCDRLFDLIVRGEKIGTARGNLLGTGADGVEPSAGRQWTRPFGDQSNSVVLAGGRYVLKLFRRIEPTTNPEYELGRYLLERGFPRVPATIGGLEYHRPRLEPGTLAVIQGAITHQGNGWQYTIDELRRFYERVATAAPPPPRLPSVPAERAPRRTVGRAERSFFESLQHWYLSTAVTLGRRTAELHIALADSTDSALVPEPYDSAALDALARTMSAHAERTLKLVESRLPLLNESTRGQAEAVLAWRGQLQARFDAIRPLDAAGMRIRVHGDYHLGQVLRTEEDFVIIDFEGEPARSIAERRAKQSPLKDIAGMVRSYSYAAYAALFAFTTHAPADFDLLEGWADAWQYWTAEAFLDGYLATASNAVFLPRGRAWTTLFSALTLDKALYELEYEMNHRPDWVRIPLLGIERLIGMSVTRPLEPRQT
jgi:maltose alpha-D-glucosyltransferase / alpha-amylase